MLIFYERLPERDDPQAAAARVLEHVFDSNGTRPSYSQRCQCGGVEWGSACSPLNCLAIVIECSPRVFDFLTRTAPARFQIVDRSRHRVAELIRRPQAEEKTYRELFPKHPFPQRRVISFRWIQTQN